MGIIKPIKLLTLSFIIWLFFYLIIDVEYLYDGSALFPFVTLLGYVLSFVFGIISLKKSSIKPVLEPSNNKIKQIVFSLFILGVIGVFFKIYTGVFNSGIFLAEDIFEKRIENMGKELTGGATGIIGSILFPFSYVAFLITLFNYKLFNRLAFITIATFGMYPFVETIFMGGRTIIALLGTTLLFVGYTSFYKNSKSKFTKIKFLSLYIFSLPTFLIKKRIIIPIGIIALIFLSYSVKVVSTRLEKYDYKDQTFEIWEQKDYQYVRFNDEIKEKYLNSSLEDKAKVIGYHSFKHYFVHGVFEYVRLVNHLDSSTGYYYGMYEFNVFFKLFKALGLDLPSVKELNEILDRKAVYQTFWGPFYIDFGVFGIVLMFCWGRFVKRVYILASRGSIPHIVFYGYLSTIIITSFFINFLLGSSSYYLFSFFVTIVIFRIWPNNFILKKVS